MESVDLIEPEAEGTYRLVNIFNQAKDFQPVVIYPDDNNAIQRN